MKFIAGAAPDIPRVLLEAQENDNLIVTTQRNFFQKIKNNA